HPDRSPPPALTLTAHRALPRSCPVWRWSTVCSPPPRFLPSAASGCAPLSRPIGSANAPPRPAPAERDRARVGIRAYPLAPDPPYPLAPDRDASGRRGRCGRDAAYPLAPDRRLPTATRTPPAGGGGPERAREGMGAPRRGADRARTGMPGRAIGREAVSAPGHPPRPPRRRAIGRGRVCDRAREGLRSGAGGSAVGRGRVA